MRTLSYVLLLSSVSLHCSTENANTNDANVPAKSPDAQVELGDGWNTIADVASGPVQEIGVASLGNTLYVLGGFNESLQLGSLLQAYDTENNSWTQAAPLPEVVHHANFVAVAGKLYVLGAMNLEGFGFRAIASSYVYDPAMDQWTAIASMPTGSERGAAAIGVIKGKVYLAGGLRDDAAVADVSSYDPVTDQWDTTLPSLPAPRDHLMGAAVNGTFYVFGGRDGSIDSVMASVLAYSPSDGSWQERTDMPTARGGGAAGVVNGKILIVGGEGNPEQASGVFAQCESFDPSTNAWTVLAPMRTPRHGMGAVGIGSRLYVPGGAIKQGFAATAKSESYTP